MSSIEELPAEFAVFPLTGALLLPHGQLPLNIFEPRYIAMVEDALAGGRMFGMIQPEPNAADGRRGPPLSRVGCLGRLSSFSETGDGRYLITLTGLARFAIAEELATTRGYRRVRGVFDDYQADLQPPSEALGRVRAHIVTALRRYFARRGFTPNWESIDGMPDGMLVISLAMLCPFEAIEKQALLEARTEADRASTLLALLEMDANEGDANGPGAPN